MRMRWRLLVAALTFVPTLGAGCAIQSMPECVAQEKAAQLEMGMSPWEVEKRIGQYSKSSDSRYFPYSFDDGSGLVAYFDDQARLTKVNTFLPPSR
jgi:hypothetical protein